MSVSTERIWQRFGRQLENFLLRRVGDPELASDLLQETFLRVHRGLGDLEDDERVLAWVYRVARNAIADHFRKQPFPASAEVDQESAEPATTSLDEQLVGWLIDMLPGLPERYREAVELAEVQGLKQREVAERLGLSLSGAKSRVQRGRELLRQALLACCHFEFDRRGNVVDYEKRGDCSDC